MKKILMAFAFMPATIHVFCQAGNLDASFNNDGKLTTLVGITSTTGESVALQTNGKIIVAGFYYNGYHNNDDFTVVRYTSTGNLDNSFAGNGKAGIDFGGDDVGLATAIQADGKIIVAGNSGPQFSNYNYVAVARLTVNGDLDPTFGNNGKVKIYSAILVNAMTIQPDGRILIAGDSNFSNNTSFALLRLQTDGRIDSAFGTNGKVYTDFFNNDDEGKSVAVQSDKKILVGGITLRNGSFCFAIARYNINGTLDATFGGDGKVSTLVGSYNSFGYGITVHNGKILQAGEYQSSSGYNQFAVVRYNSDGTLDNSFAGNGKAAVAFAGGSGARNVGIQSNGKIIVTGTFTDYHNLNFAMARLHTDGSIDNTFGTSGKVTTGFGGNEYGVSSVIQPDNKIIIAGLSIADKYRIAVARYIGSNSSFADADETNAIASSIQMNKQQALLSQNFPNPFSNTTTISYSIPQQFSSAKIIITDKNENALKQANLSNNKGSIGVDASTLINGAYQYSLYVDGRLVVTKQLVISK